MYTPSVVIDMSSFQPQKSFGFTWPWHGVQASNELDAETLSKRAIRRTGGHAHRKREAVNQHGRPESEILLRIAASAGADATTEGKTVSFSVFNKYDACVMQPPTKCLQWYYASVAKRIEKTYSESSDYFMSNGAARFTGMERVLRKRVLWANQSQSADAHVWRRHAANLASAAWRREVVGASPAAADERCEEYVIDDVTYASADVRGTRPSWRHRRRWRRRPNVYGQPVPDVARLSLAKSATSGTRRGGRPAHLSRHRRAQTLRQRRRANVTAAHQRGAVRGACASEVERVGRACALRRVDVLSELSERTAADRGRESKPLSDELIFMIALLPAGVLKHIEPYRDLVRLFWLVVPTVPTETRQHTQWGWQ